MGELGGLVALDRASLFDAVEQAATRVGLGVFVVHIDAAPPTVLYASSLLGEFVGRSADELVGKPPWELVAAEQRDRVRTLIASRGPGAPPITYEAEVERPDGSRRDVEVGVARITSPEAELAVCYFRDVTNERRAIAALRRSEARFRSLIENAPDGVAILRDGRIALANPSAVRMLGASDLASVRGRPLLDFLPPEDAARALLRIAASRAGAEIAASEYRVIPTGLTVEVRSIPFDFEGEPATLAFVRDVTDRARLHRLAAAGTMAASVAHEINNPLAYVQLNLEQIAIVAAADPDPARAALLRECVTDALHGVDRIGRIVRDLRMHARDDAGFLGPVDVIAVVNRAVQMVEHDLRHRAQLVRRYGSEPAIVEAVAGRLEQVVLNVLINAIQSLGVGDPSKDRITIEVCVGREVMIKVADTGAGISAADRERVFDPFFTTKPIGEGTGLGLAICKGIVERMSGRVALTSELGVGTEVTITLPLGTPLRAASAADRADVEEPRRLRVLVIDDEPILRNSLRMLLLEHHDVDGSEGGEHALSALREHRYDAILCDLMMPLMNGRDLYERIRACHPGLEHRIVFVTGGAFIRSLAEFLESVDNPRLMKPYTHTQVLDALRTVASSR